jgi:hypothetical protein
MDHKEHLEEIAHAAAALYGQEWQHIPHWTKEMWKETVRLTPRAGGDTHIERFAGQAIDEWYKKREEPPAEPKPAEPVADKKTKKKRGED